MTETIIRYTLIDKNHAKLQRMASAVALKAGKWLDGRPSGQLVLTVEINANQGGIGDMFIEEKNKGRI